MSIFSKLFVFLCLIGTATLIGLYSAYSSCSLAKNKLDEAKIEFAEQLAELRQTATKVATMSKITFPNRKKTVKKIEFLQAKIEQNPTEAEMIRLCELLNLSLKNILNDLINKTTGSRKQKIKEINFSFKLISQNSTASSSNFFSKAKLYNQTFEGFFFKVFSPFIPFKPVELLPLLKKK